MIALLAGTAAARAEAPIAAHWRLEARPAPTDLALGGEGLIVVTASNIGDAEARGSEKGITIEDTLPKALEVTEIGRSGIAGTPLAEEGLERHCSQPGETPVRCTYSGDVTPYELLELFIYVRVKERPSELNKVTVAGGETVPTGREVPSASLSSALNVSEKPTGFGVERFELTAENDEFAPDERAGSHPFQLTTTFELHESSGYDPPSTELFPTAPALQKNVSFKLPAGLLGDVNAVPKCPGAAFGALEKQDLNDCPSDTAVGVASVTINDPVGVGYHNYSVPVFNLEPAPGEPAQFGFSVIHVPVVLNTSVRTGEDYGVTVSVLEASEAIQVLGARVTLWGVPGDPRHNSSRGWECLGNGGWPKVAPAKPCEARGTLPFLMLPTNCGERLTTTLEGEAWNGAPLVGDTESSIGPLTGCAALQEKFEPSLEVQPDRHAASTPTGLTVKVRLPQQSTLEGNEEVCEKESSRCLSEPDLRDTLLELPEGIETNAGAANGLETCGVSEGPNPSGFEGSEAATGETLEKQLEEQHFTPGVAECPNAAKIGTVEIKTPVLERPLTGALYLGYQDTKPFQSPLVLYLVAEERRSPEEEKPKVLVKLAGEVKISESGQLVARFANAPQAPVEEVVIHLFNTERASQSTPAFCGPHHASAHFTNWSAPESAPSEGERTAKGEFEITEGANGAPCTYEGATLPLSASMDAGATNPQAGAFSPFTLTLYRPDGNQALKTISVTLPEGAAAVLASVTPCPEAQASKAECGEQSNIGVSTALSGLGSAPVSLPGKVYLTGPYKGAPFGILDVTNAEHVGPFNVGEIVVRSTITINPETAQATITSDEIPQFAEALGRKRVGAPAQIKVLSVTVDRPNFELNPTSCAELHANGTLTGYEGASDPVSSRFQAANCAALAFKPQLSASVDGQGSKEDGIGFDVKVTSAGLGVENIHKVFLTIPKLLPARLKPTLNSACLEKVFNENPARCPEDSVIGTGTVHTPIFKDPLTGPAYVVSHGNAAFPDVEFVLQGEGVEVILDGKTDIKAGVTYSRFETTPDSPFTSFETDLPAGPHSIFTANTEIVPDYNVCKQTIGLPTEITAQDGLVIKKTTPVKIIGCTAETSQQKLAKALESCKKDKKRSKRLACEKAARKKYAPTKHKKRAKKSSGKNKNK